MPLLLKVPPPQIPCAQEASGSVQLFLQCISVHHFCQLLGVVDPLSAATFNQGKSSPATHRHTGICPSRVGHPSGPCSSQPSTIWAPLPTPAVLPVTLPQHVLTVKLSLFKVCPRQQPPSVCSPSLQVVLYCLCYAMCLKPHAFSICTLSPLENTWYF